MADSETTICNMALSHLGAASTITDMEEDSAEARACSLFFDTVKDKLQRDFKLMEQRAFATLSLIEEDPSEEWAYSYGRPADCLDIVRIFSGSRTDSKDSKVVFRPATIGGQKVILTDMEDAAAEYILRVDVGTFSANVDLAMSYLLASYIAPRLNNSFPATTIEKLRALYDMEKAQALENHAFEEVSDLEQEAEWVRGRN